MTEFIKVQGLGDICELFQLTIENDEELNPPEPKTYTVDITGGNGVIDLTDALTGNTAYEQRKQTFKLWYRGEDGTWEQAKTKVLNALHGRRLSYELSFDPGYVYTGRFNVLTTTRLGYGFRAGEFELTITADPYKNKGTQAFKLNATGGKLYRFESGRRPVHPTIECSNVVYVRNDDGIEETVPSGTYRLNNVLFTEGVNEFYINTAKIWLVYWGELGKDGDHAMTWGQAESCTWDDIQRLGVGTTQDAPQAWLDLNMTNWSELAAKQWKQLDYRREELPNNTAYLTYEWEDL